MGKDKPISIETIAQLKRQAETISSEGDLETALALLDQAEALAQTLGDPLAMGLVWRGRAHAWQIHSHFEASLEAVNQAVAIYEVHGTPLDVAKAQVTAVYKLGLMGRFDEAFALAKWIQPHFADDRFFQAVLAANLAPLYTWTGQYKRAMETNQQAWALFTELDMPLRATDALHNMGVAAQEMDDLSLAHDCFTRAYSEYAAADNVLVMFRTQFNLAKLCVRQNQLQAAMTHLAQARADAECLPPDSPDMAHVDVYEARVYQALNQPQEAERLLRRALSIFVQSDWQLDFVETRI
jgi:tetratricopeptide (TPR) repeat protein